MSIKQEADVLVTKALNEFSFTPAAHRVRIFNVESILEISRDNMVDTKVGITLSYIHKNKELLQDFVDMQKAFMHSNYSDMFKDYETLRISVEHLLELAEQNENVTKQSALTKPKFIIAIALTTTLVYVIVMFVLR